MHRKMHNVHSTKNEILQRAPKAQPIFHKACSLEQLGPNIVLKVVIRDMRISYIQITRLWYQSILVALPGLRTRGKRRKAP